MTRNESFKRRIRERMAQTGERYGAARRVLLERAAARERDGWVSEPEHTDEVVRAKTGRGWDEWRELIDAWPGHADGHAAVAVAPRPDGRATVHISHTKLGSPDEVALWKGFWGDRLTTLEDAG
jgi:hypothetical protein